MDFASRALCLAAILAGAAAGPSAGVHAQEARGGSGGQVLDEAEVFSPEARTELKRRIDALSRRTGADIYVYTRATENLDTFADECEETFREIVKRAVHYKIALIVLGYESNARSRIGRGKMYTALGAGLIHVVSKARLEEILSTGGSKVSPETVIQGVDRLAGVLEQYYAETTSVGPPGVPGGSGGGSAKLRMDLLIGLGSVLVLVLLIRRVSRCPRCGARLRRQVKILPAGAEGSRHTVKRTAKCFTCGYVRRGILF